MAGWRDAILVLVSSSVALARGTAASPREKALRWHGNRQTHGRPPSGDARSACIVRSQSTDAEYLSRTAS